MLGGGEEGSDPTAELVERNRGQRGKAIVLRF